MPAKRRLLYSSPNGDRWLFCHDAAAERVFVRHEAHRPSGGQVSDIDIGSFLSGGPVNPEHEARLRLLGTLVDNEPLADEASVAKPLDQKKWCAAR